MKLEKDRPTGRQDLTAFQKKQSIVQGSLTARDLLAGARHKVAEEQDRTNEQRRHQNHLFSDLLDSQHNDYKPKRRSNINSFTDFLDPVTLNKHSVKGETAFEKKQSLYNGQFNPNRPD